MERYSYLSLPILETNLTDGRDYEASDTTTFRPDPDHISSVPMDGVQLTNPQQNTQPKRQSPRFKSQPGNEPPHKSCRESSSLSPLNPRLRKNHTSRSFSINHKSRHSISSNNDESPMTRSNHNEVEKQYRNRLNSHFESLLSSLPKGATNSESRSFADGGDKKVSKGDVLIMAKERIQDLERENKNLERGRDALKDQVGYLEENWVMSGRSLMP